MHDGHFIAADNEVSNNYGVALPKVRGFAETLSGFMCYMVKVLFRVVFIETIPYLVLYIQLLFLLEKYYSEYY